ISFHELTRNIGPSAIGCAADQAAASCTPALFGSFVRDAAAWSAAHPIADGPMLLVNSWNEIGEGQTVVPTHDDGYAYGQALAEAIGVPWSPPPQRTISITARKGGTIRSNPVGISCPPRCTMSIANGTEIALAAAAR